MAKRDFSMSEYTNFAGFILCDFVVCVLLAVFTLAIGAASLWNVDLIAKVLSAESPSLGVLYWSNHRQNRPVCCLGLKLR